MSLKISNFPSQHISHGPMSQPPVPLTCIFLAAVSIARILWPECLPSPSHTHSEHTSIWHVSQKIDAISLLWSQQYAGFISSSLFIGCRTLCRAKDPRDGWKVAKHEWQYDTSHCIQYHAALVADGISQSSHMVSLAGGNSGKSDVSDIGDMRSSDTGDMRSDTGSEWTSWAPIQGTPGSRSCEYSDCVPHCNGSQCSPRPGYEAACGHPALSDWNSCSPMDTWKLRKKE